MEDKIKEIAAYVREQIGAEEFDLKKALALIEIGKHMPIDRDFADLVYSYVEEWCDDHDYSIDFFDDIDIEEIIFAEI